MSLAILNRPAASGVERAVREHVGVVRGERLELVGRGDEGQAGEARRSRRRSGSAKCGLGVEPGADRGAALRQRIELRAASP